MPSDVELVEQSLGGGTPSSDVDLVEQSLGGRRRPKTAPVLLGEPGRLPPAPPSALGNKPVQVLSMSELPFATRHQIYLRRGKPDELTAYLKGEGFEIEPPDVGGRILLRRGNQRFDLNEALPGQSLLHHAPGVALTAIPSLLLGPGAGALARMGGAAIGSLAGTGFGGLERKAAGLPADLDPKSTLLNALLAGGTEGMVSGAGSIGRELVGKSAGKIAFGQAAEKQAREIEAQYGAAAAAQFRRSQGLRESALESVAKQQATAAKGVASAEQAAEDFVARQRERAEVLARREAAPAELERVMPRTRAEFEAARGLPGPAKTAETARAQAAVRVAPTQIFGRLTRAFNETLEKYRAEPITSTLDEMVQLQRNWLKQKQLQTSPQLQGVMGRLRSLVRPGAEELEAQAGGEFLPNVQRKTVTVDQLAGIKTQLGEFATSKNAVDRRIAKQLSNAIDDELEVALPEEVQGRYAALRREWGQQAATFNQGFRRTIYTADNPGQVASTLLDPRHGERALSVFRELRQSAPEDLPVVRNAMIDRLYQMSPTPEALRGNIVRMDPQIFREVFAGTPFRSPREMIRTIERSMDLSAALQRDPALLARFQESFDRGVSSLSAKQRARAVQRARDAASSVPDVDTALREATQFEPTPARAGAGAVAGMPSPEEAGTIAAIKAFTAPWRWTNYITNSAVFGLSSAMLLGYVHGTPIRYALAAGTLAGHHLFRKAVENPANAARYWRALNNPSVERMAFGLGRLSGAMLAETGRAVGETASSRKPGPTVPASTGGALGPPPPQSKTRAPESGPGTDPRIAQRVGELRSRGMPDEEIAGYLREHSLDPRAYGL